MTSLTLLDCTLRDGGYYNQWDFPKDLIEKYLVAMQNAKMDFVELGLRSLVKDGYKGPCAYTTDTFIESINIPQELNIGVMVNASELLEKGSNQKIQEKLSQLFKPSSKSKVKLVRIACHIREFEASLSAANWLHDNGYIVGFNLMQIASQPLEKITKLAKIASNYPVDVLYFADSMGSMNAEDTKCIVQALRNGWKGALGIHTHDNMGNALANSIAATEHGVEWIDGTVTGMGRGPGNVQTEYLLLAFQHLRNNKINMTHLLELISSDFEPMQQHFGWGSNPYYYLAGKYNIHPSFIQEMLADQRYNAEDILAAIDHLKKIDGTKFSKSILESTRNFYCGKASGQWSPNGLIQGKDVLILGTGPGTFSHKEAIEQFIEKCQPIVIALNTQTNIAEHLIDIRAACHPVRLMADCDHYLALPQPLATPASMLPTHIREILNNKEVLDFGITITEDGFAISDHYATVPSPLVVAYALAIATSGGTKQIYLAGFDGYSADDPRRTEADGIFKKYRETPNAAKLTAITPTTYELSSTSVYALSQ